MNQNFKEFFDSTPNNAHIEICQDTNDNIIWSGLFQNMPNTFDNMVVTSYDVTEMSDDTLDIGVIIE